MDAIDLLTAGEAAIRLRMPSARLARLARDGKVPCVNLPDGELRFDETDLTDWVDRHKSNPKKSKPICK